MTWQLTETLTVPPRRKPPTSTPAEQLALAVSARDRLWLAAVLAAPTERSMEAARAASRDAASTIPWAETMRPPATATMVMSSSTGMRTTISMDMVPLSEAAASMARRRACFFLRCFIGRSGRSPALRSPRP